MRLNGWQRIGIVVSVVWAIGAGTYKRHLDMERANFMVTFAYEVCTEGKSLKQDYDYSSCLQKNEKNWAVWLEGSWGNVAIVSLLPIPLCWLVVYIIIRIHRWVKVGFKREQLKKQPPT